MDKLEIARRVRGLLAQALMVDPAAIPDHAAQVDLADWDSTAHMTLVTALENEFDIEFDYAELPTLTSLPLLVAAVEKHLTP